MDRITDEEFERLRKTVGLLQYDTAFNIGSTLLAALEAEREHTASIEKELEELRILCEFYAFLNEDDEKGELNERNVNPVDDLGDTL